MNAEQLYLADSTPSGVYFCTQCRVVYSEHDAAERCCKPVLCECGATCDKYRSTCWTCVSARLAEREQKAWERATKTPLSEYTLDTVYVGDDYLLVGELETRLDDDPDNVPRIYACTASKPSIDTDGVIDDALECANAYDGAENDIPKDARAELRDYVAAWCEQYMPLVYHQDPKHGLTP